MEIIAGVDIGEDTLPPVAIDLLEQPVTTPEHLSWRQKLSVIASLGTMAVYGYTAEHADLSQKLIEPFRAIAESVAHPVIGYTATCLTVAATNAAVVTERIRNNKVGQRLGAWLGKHALMGKVIATTAANFATETAQMLLIGHGPNANFLAHSQWFETSKDWLFAFGGMGLYYAHDRYHNRKQAAEVAYAPVAERLAA